MLYNLRLVCYSIRLSDHVERNSQYVFGCVCCIKLVRLLLHKNHLATVVHFTQPHIYCILFITEVISKSLQTAPSLLC